LAHLHTEMAQPFVDLWILALLCRHPMHARKPKSD
jgi:hypothetical protein